MSVVLGPGLNIKRHPCAGATSSTCRRIHCSADTWRRRWSAASRVRGWGLPEALRGEQPESHRLVVDAVVDERTLRELYLSGFEYASQHSSPWSVMAAYNQANGTYCCDNEYLLTTILRDEWVSTAW